VDENTERRNHYLDLAGIENYTSRFEGNSLFVVVGSHLYYSNTMKLNVAYDEAEG